MFIQNGGKSSDEIVEMLPGDGIGYLCPQSFRPSLMEGNGEVSFRVRAPMDNVSIVIEKDGVEVQAIRKLKVIPSEMEKLPLKKEVLEGAKTIKVYARKN
jgi:hypothetical protein